MLILYLLFNFATHIFLVHSAELEIDSPWPRWRHNNNGTGFSPHVPGHGDANSVELVATYAIDAVILGSATITRDGTILFGGYDNNLHAIGFDGTEKWIFETDGIIEVAPCIGADGSIYFSSGDDYFYAITPDGDLQWKRQTFLVQSSSPTIDTEGNILFGAFIGLYSFFPNGTQNWYYPVLVYTSAVVSTQGVIYIGSFDGNLYAIRTNGTLVWKNKYGAAARSTCAIDMDGTIYLGTAAYDLYAINPDGTVKWTFSTGNQIISSPAIYEDKIFFGSLDRSFYCINNEGELQWNYTTSLVVSSSPAIASDGSVYVAGWDSNVYAFKQNGDLKWKFVGDSLFKASPSLGPDGQVVLGSNAGTFYILANKKESSPSSNTILLVAIVVPIGSVLILLAVGFYCCSRQSYSSADTDKSTSSKVTPMGIVKA